jgi:two-component system sensor histidine kinase CpxA
VRSLYWRIFLAFWAVIVITVAVTMTVNRIATSDEAARARIAALQASMVSLERDAARELAGGGEAALRAWLAEHERLDPSPPLLIIDEGGNDLLGRPVPPPGAWRRGPEGLPRVGPRPRPMFHAEIFGPDGTRYRMLVPPFSPRFGGWFASPISRLLFPLVLLVVSGVACLLLAVHLTRPIRALGAAGRQIAGGNLAARIPAPVAARRDEFGELARDFNEMAARIQALVESRERLLRDVSHELRSPLTRLNIATELLRKKAGPEHEAALDRIERETRNLDLLIGQVLAFSRVQSQAAPSRGPVDLAALVGSVVDDAAFEGRAQGLELAVQGEALPTITADEGLLRSALENVVRNALQHARQRVTLAGALDDGWIRIVITDDGSGAEPADLPRLFEPFFTGSRGRRPDGAGIGLAIAQRTVELHGGSIGARNAADGGLEVTISLPA